MKIKKILIYTLCLIVFLSSNITYVNASEVNENDSIIEEQTNETEGLQKLPVFFRKILKGLVGEIVFLAQILENFLRLRLFEMEDLIVDIFHIKSVFAAEIVVSQWIKDRLNIADTQDIFEIVDKDQRQKMLLGVFFLLRRWKQIVLGVVVDHGFGQNLIVFIAFAGI